MPRINAEIYQCDSCDEKFFEPEDVLIVEKPITDGADGVVMIEGMFCPKCFLTEVFVARDILDDIIEISERVQDEQAANEREDGEEEEDKMPWDEKGEGDE
jgi:hypothetical protein